MPERPARASGGDPRILNDENPIPGQATRS